ncbi:hypothetical protein B8B80_21715 [Pseudomonas aeruginosa]|nr:hypothetical protein CGU46_21140 [Pseudomonas aeruginosa]ASP15029.1 hypothetical protein CGU45_28160 [Pseudomonas aeruginosa]AVZ35692.1 hypothetical protein B8B76_21210 [Pseudomonas aeruginosa]KAA5633181.1 hypothetical protein F3G89_05880 [Pseudomonas aeruginosa]MCO2418086.1 hypothetical protein [Pseudomonas aeruginosa]
MLHSTFLTRLRFRSADNAGGVIRPTRLTQRVIGHSSSLGAPYPPVSGMRYPGIRELNSSVIFPGSGFSHESFRQ